MSNDIRVLIAGIDFNWTRTHRANNNVQFAAIEKMFDEVAAMPGVYSEVCFVTPDHAASLESYKKEITGEKWDAVSLGYGVRGDPALTPLFEQMVNILRENAPETKILFTSPLGDHVDMVKRNFPELR